MMNFKIKTFNNNFIFKVLSLIFIAVIGFVIEKNLKFIFLFSLSRGLNLDIRNSLSILPVLLLLHVGMKQFVTNQKVLNAVVPSYYVFIFLFLSPNLLIALLYVLFFSSLFFLEKLSSKGLPFLGWLLLFIIILMIFIPIFLYGFASPLSPLQLYFLILMKSCFLMRLLSWFIDRKIYKRVRHGSFLEFIEFIFCPIFFIFPGQIQFFLFDYFHENKIASNENMNIISILWLGLWGYFLMMVYSALDYFFIDYFKLISHWIGIDGFWRLQFLAGFYWLITVYFHHTAGMAYQISLARIMGYNFKYDMQRPFLARSPLDFLRRHSSYARDFIVEMGLRPLALFSLRKGLSSNFVIPTASILSYALFSSMQIGYRSDDYHRPWATSLVMISFLAIAVSLPFLQSFLKNNLSSTTNTDSLLRGTDDKPLGQWTMQDYLRWLGTITFMICLRMFQGLARRF